MKVHVLAAALLATAPALSADELPDASADAIRAHTAFLADDLLEGRATGSRGYEIAARYVATQMELMGLKPAGTGGDWLQPVGFVEARRDIGNSRASVAVGGQTVDLVPGKDFLPGVSYSSTEATVSAPLVFVGFGIHAPEYGYDDFGGIDLEGKIAVVLDGSPSSLPSTIRAHYSRQKVKEIASRGAIGLVSAETPQSVKRFPWEKAVQLATLPRRRLLDDQGQPVDAYPEIRASVSLNLPVAATLFAGAPKTADQVFADAEAGVPQAFDLPAAITITLRNELGHAGSANVVGLLEGADPDLKDEYIVFTAHLDHLGRGTEVGGDSIYNGALDNASGVATMLEATRILVGSAVRPRRSVLVVAVTGEENGLLGSERFATAPTVPQEALVANLNMDMPVLLHPVGGFVAYGAEHSSLGAVAARAMESEGLALVPDPHPDEVFFVRSDQYSFVKQGIPALYIDDAAFSSDPDVDADAVLKKHLLEHYHMPSDDMSLPIHWPSFARLARVNARIALEVANAPARPDWLPGDFFGSTFGRKAP